VEAGSALVNVFKPAAIDAAKVAVAALGTVGIDPLLETWFPAAPKWSTFFASAIIAAVLLQVLISIVLGRNPVRVVWCTVADKTPLGNFQLVFQAAGESAERYVIKVERPPMGWLTRWFAGMLVDRGLVLTIQINDAPIYTQVAEGSRAQADDRRLVYEQPPTAVVCEMTQLLDEGMWRFGEVVFKKRESQADLDCTVSYQWSTRKSAAKNKKSWWAHRALKVTSDVKIMRIVGA
jgi:hypothetical protein